MKPRDTIDNLRVLCGRLLVASIVAGLDAPTKVLLHGMRRAGWGATTASSASLAYAALRGMLSHVDDEAKAGVADTGKRIAFINQYPWFGGEPTDGVEN